MSQTVRGVLRTASLLSLPKAILLLLLLAVVLVWLFFAPEPHLRNRFGFPSPAPIDYESAVASMSVKFPSLLRHLVTLESVEFTDSSGQYVQENAWVNLIEGGGTLWGTSALEGWPLADPAGYRIREPNLGLVFEFRIAHAPDNSLATDGVYRIKLHLRFAGRRYTRTVAWRNYPVYLQEID